MEDDTIDEYTLHSMSTRRRIPKYPGEFDVMSGFGRYGYDPFGDPPEADAGVAGEAKPKLKSPPRAPPHSPPPEVAYAEVQEPPKQLPTVDSEPFIWQAINFPLSIFRLALLFIGAIPIFLYVFDAHLKQFFRSIWLGVSAKVIPSFTEAKLYDLGKYILLLLILAIFTVATFGPQAPGGAGGASQADVDQLTREVSHLKHGQKSLTELQSAFSGLQSKFSTELEASKKLSGDHNWLKGDHQKLHDAHAALEAKHLATAKELTATKSELDKAVKTLADVQQTLTSYASKSSLQKFIDDVNNQITVLQAAQPSTTTSGDATPSAALTELLHKMKVLDDKYTQFTDSQESKLQELSKASQGHAEKVKSDLEKQLDAATAELTSKIAAIPHVSVDSIIDQVKSSLTAGMSHDEVAAVIKDQLSSGDIGVALYNNQYRSLVTSQLKEQIDPAIHKLEQSIQRIGQQQQTTQQQPSQTVNAGGLDHNALVRLILHEVQTHPLDGVERADWAAPQIGGVVIVAPHPDTTRHVTPGAGATTVQLSRMITMFGLNSKWDKQSMISPVSIPGSCYPLDTLPANVTIKLATAVIVDSVTIDHIYRQINWNDAKSAPHKVGIYGHTQSSAHYLGEVEYDITNWKPAQTFAVNNPNKQAFIHVTFEVKSTWGSESACIYRLRVHGEDVNGMISGKAVAAAAQSA